MNALKLHYYKLLTIFIKEETQFKMPQSEFPFLDTVKVALDPYNRLFQTVSKWQRNEKK